MSPEHPTDPPEEPKRRAFYTPPGTQAEQIVAGVLARVNDVEAELRIVDGFLAHGAGFAAWLRLGDTHPVDPASIDRYEASYADAWRSLDHLAADTAEALGWTDALTALRKEWAIPDGLLTWNYTVMYTQLHDMYDFIELDDTLHAFHR